MVAVDTNVLVRIFIDDLEKEQITKARQLAQEAKHIYITQIVLIEMVWVLLRPYQLSKQQIMNILQEIYENSAFVVEHEAYFLEALTLFKGNNVDFSDCMILVCSKAAKVEHFYTFDAKFSKLIGVKRL